MQIVLHHPDHGYYRHGNPLGKDYDFSTAPEVSPLFGEMVGIWCIRAWERLGKPHAFTLLELGPGQGTMLQAAFACTRNTRGFHEAMQLRLLESNATLRSMQAEKFRADGVVHINRVGELPALPLIVLANEFFDTLPIRQFVRTFFGWRERLVTLNNGTLQFTLGHPNKLPPDLLVNPAVKNMPRGSMYETAPQMHDIAGKIVRHLAENGGAGLMIDYGYSVPPKAGTLDAISKRRFVDVLTAPGKVDVTAGVDFAVLAGIAIRGGVNVEDLMTQSQFLQKMGILLRADMVKSAAPHHAAAIDRSLHYLMSEKQMGKFKVLTMMKDIPSRT